MTALKTILFHILYGFRGIIRLALKFAAGISTIALITYLVLGLTQKIGTSLFLVTLGWAIIPRIVLWYYDALIFKLKPDNMDLYLFS